MQPPRTGEGRYGESVALEKHMAKVEVCAFKKYDIMRGETLVGLKWGTREAIAKIGATVIEQSCIEIDEKLLDPMEPGFTKRDFVPPAT